MDVRISVWFWVSVLGSTEELAYFTLTTGASMTICMKTPPLPTYGQRGVMHELGLNLGHLRLWRKRVDNIK